MKTEKAKEAGTPAQLHTPLPWSVETDYGGRTLSIVCESDSQRVIVGFPYGDSNREVNADFIVQACNCHYELLDACKKALAFFQSPSKTKAIKATKTLKVIIKETEGVKA